MGRPAAAVQGMGSGWRAAARGKDESSGVASIQRSRRSPHTSFARSGIGAEGELPLRRKTSSVIRCTEDLLDEPLVRLSGPSVGRWGIQRAGQGIRNPYHTRWHIAPQAQGICFSAPIAHFFRNFFTSCATTNSSLVGMMAILTGDPSAEMSPSAGLLRFRSGSSTIPRFSMFEAMVVRSSTLF